MLIGGEMVSFTTISIFTTTHTIIFDINYIINIINLNINYIINIINTETKFKIKYIQPTISYNDIETIPCEQRVLTKEDLIDNRYLNIKKYIIKYTCLLVNPTQAQAKQPAQQTI